MSGLELAASEESRTVPSRESSEIQPWLQAQACDSDPVLAGGGNGQTQCVEHPQMSTGKPGLSLSSRGRVALVDLRTPRIRAKRKPSDRVRKMASRLPRLARASACGGYFRFEVGSGLAFIPYSWLLS